MSIIQKCQQCNKEFNVYPSGFGKRKCCSKSCSNINMTGRKLSEEHKRKMGENYRGEKHPNWKGGITLGENRKEYYRKKTLERIARKACAEGSHTLGEWQTLKAQYNWTCPCCNRKEPEIKLTEDHIIPLIKGGSDNIENIQPLCLSCNGRKSTKIIKF